MSVETFINMWTKKKPSYVNKKKKDIISLSEKNKFENVTSSGLNARAVEKYVQFEDTVRRKEINKKYTTQMQ